MKYNRIIIGFAIIVSMTLLNGCAGIGNLSEEGSDLVAEYSAGVLLRYSKDYDRRLITREQAVKEGLEDSVLPTASPTPTPVPSDPALATEEPSSGVTNPNGTEEEEDTSSEVALNQLYQMNGIDFSYDTYKFCNQFSQGKNDMQRIAKKGETFLVVTFRVKNNSAGKKTVDLQKRNIQYLLTIDGNEYDPSESFLKNGGMDRLNTTLGKGKSEDAVLIYNLSEDRKKAGEISLVIRDEKGGRKTSIQLK
ncbi:MAG: DUF4352 domain-containing protein [Lachnospiraceae bacterium]|nr:DUF4352 domain-containing protein [Lachnospiraceae bacterium]